MAKSKNKTKYCTVQVTRFEVTEKFIEKVKRLNPRVTVGQAFVELIEEYGVEYLSSKRKKHHESLTKFNEAIS